MHIFNTVNIGVCAFLVCLDYSYVDYCRVTQAINMTDVLAPLIDYYTDSLHLLSAFTHIAGWVCVMYINRRSMLFYDL